MFGETLTKVATAMGMLGEKSREVTDAVTELRNSIDRNLILVKKFPSDCYLSVAEKTAIKRFVGAAGDVCSGCLIEETCSARKVWVDEEVDRRVENKLEEAKRAGEEKGKKIQALEEMNAQIKQDLKKEVGEGEEFLGAQVKADAAEVRKVSLRKITRQGAEVEEDRFVLSIGSETVCVICGATKRVIPQKLFSSQKVDTVKVACDCGWEIRRLTGVK